MSDDNITNLGDFKKSKEESKGKSEHDTRKEVTERIMAENKNPDEETEYTKFKEKMVETLINTISKEFYEWMKETGGTLCSHDYKDVLIRTIYEIEEEEFQQLEKEYSEIEKQLEGKTTEEIKELLESELNEISRILGKGEDDDPEGEE